MLKIEVFEDIPQDWDEFIKSGGNEANICQSSYWARVIKRLDKATPYFFRIKDSKDLILAQALVFKRYYYKRDKQRKIFPLPYLECLDGPVILDQSNALSATEEILKATINLSRRTIAMYIVFSPAHTSKWALDRTISEIYRKYGFSVGNWGTFLIDLNTTEDKLFETIKPKARGKIRKAKKMNLAIRKPAGLDDFVKNWGEVYADGGVKITSHYRNVEITFEEDKQGYYHYYLTCDEERNNLAVVGMYIFNGVATRISSSISSICKEKHIPAQDLLTWHCILEAKCSGCHTFDLAGVSPNPQTPKELGIRQFKEKWGGMYVEYHIYRKEMKPLLNRGIKYLIALKKKVSGLLIR